MTEDQIKYGIWNIEKGIIPPTNSVTLFEDYKPAAKLSLHITQTDLTPYQQQKNIETWCDNLPLFDEIRFLWLPSKVNQKIFDAVCKMSNLEGIWIKWSGIKNLDQLPQLKNLRHFRLGSSSQVESIEVLSNMRNLITLELEQLNNISDFSPISDLIQLEGLGMDGSIWTPQKINSLEPVRDLKLLKYLTTTNSYIKDKSFDPLLNLSNLVRFHCSWNYPDSEFAKLKSLPNLRYGNVETSWKELKADAGLE